jgi:hypothetical protein
MSSTSSSSSSAFGSSQSASASSSTEVRTRVAAIDSMSSMGVRSDAALSYIPEGGESHSVDELFHSQQAFEAARRVAAANQRQY